MLGFTYTDFDEYKCLKWGFQNVSESNEVYEMLRGILLLMHSGIFKIELKWKVVLTYVGVLIDEIYKKDLV